MFYWFRWGAMYTFVFGWLLFGYKYVHQKLLSSTASGVSHRAMWILFGGLIGTIMWFNVWFVIWPRQKQILGGMVDGHAPPRRRRAGRHRAEGLALQPYASGPMLFGMIVPNNYPGLTTPRHDPRPRSLGVGFWFGMIKRSFKIKPTV